jgi:hypothetical protein
LASEAGVSIELDIEFPTLIFLELYLNPELDQKSQLRPFMNSPILEYATINGLIDDGVEFMLQTKTHWPDDIELRIQRDVSESRMLELRRQFPDTDWED